MLRKTKDVMEFTLAARDGELGRVKDFYFDDENWTIRYLIADTGKWLELRRVLISPFAIRQFHDPEKAVEIGLTKAQIEGSPTIDTDAPVSRQYEMEYYRYYGWPFYWQGTALWGPSSRPSYRYFPGLASEVPSASGVTQASDPHLHSTGEILGYHLQASDAELGQVEDFVFDDTDWAIHYLVVNTGNWWRGKKVLLPPDWAGALDWERSRVHVNLEQSQIAPAPEYDPSLPITREYEARLFSHYSRQPYWERPLAA
jgi:PRC-barrel domain